MKMIKKYLYEVIAVLFFPLALLIALLGYIYTEVVLKAVNKVFAIGFEIKKKIYIKTLLDIQNRLNMAARYVSETHIKLSKIEDKPKIKRTKKKWTNSI